MMTKSSEKAKSNATGEFDTSELLLLLGKLDGRLDALHSYLHAFAQGTTRELRGEKTRGNLRYLLSDMDSLRKNIDDVLAKEKPRLEGHITAQMKTTVADASRHYDALRSILYRIVAAEMHEHNISRTDNSNIFGFLDLLQNDLDSLQDQVDPD